MTAPVVLLIDDDEAWASLVVEAFARVSSVDRVEVITDPDAGLARLGMNGSIVTIVLDLNLAGRDGVDLLRDIRALAGDTVRVVVMSSSVALKDRVAVEALDAEFVTKPTSFPELCGVVAELTAT